MMRAQRVLLLLLLMAVLAFGCEGSGDLPLDQVDPEAAPADPTYDEVFAILHNRCANCHAGSDDDDDDDDGDYSVSRLRATAGDSDPDFTDCVEIVAFAGDIVTEIENNRMPPGAMPRLTSAQKLLIRRWVENGTPAPCN